MSLFTFNSPQIPEMLIDNKPISLAGDTGAPKTPTSVFSSGQTTKQKYNELFHEVELYLDNSGNFNGKPETRFHINPASVLSMTITDTFMDWVTDGYMAFMYLPEDVPDEDLAGQTSDTKVQGAKDNGNLLKSYKFRADGFDLLRVMIRPVVDNNEPQSGNPLPINPEKPEWCLSFLFSIYDVEDVVNVPGSHEIASSYMKCLKIYFRDIRYQILKTTNLEYSTATSKDYTSNFNSGLDNEGVLKVGDAMLEVFNKALGNPETGGSLEFQQMDGSDKWDRGGNEIFYTSPAEYSAFDDIEYLYSHHVSSNPLQNSDINDICILHSDRATTPTLLGPICLTPLSQLFAKAGKTANEPGELQLEHFFVSTYATGTEKGKDENTDVTRRYKAPLGTQEDRDIKTAKYGQILSYSFVDMSPEINSSIFSTFPVYSVDIAERRFNVEFQKNTVENARKLIADSYISQLYKNDSNNEDLFLSTLHRQKESQNRFPTFSLYGDNPLTRQKNGIHQLLYTGLFQNTCICFKTLGLTLRQSGTFIAIDRMDGSKNDDYNNKLYGQWFVVKVDHVFEAGKYLNAIYAVKIHRFESLKQKFEGTI